MIRKTLLPIALFMVLALLAYCGGAGTSSVPVGVNPGQPSIVQLQSVQQIVQTNSNIYLKAKVLDGNGRVVPNVQVTFTNLSLVGVLSSTQAMTDSSGFATVTLFSTDSGFSTVQAEVDTGTGKVRDKKTVFFSIFDLTTATSAPTLTLAVDNNNDGIYNDPSDFIFFDPADPHDEAIIRATVLDGTGAPVVNDTVTFGADNTEATFPNGNAVQTNSAGQAFVLIKIVPTELTNITVPLNVNAVSTKTGAFNVITLFIGPITINAVTVVADPQSIASAATSTITAIVTTAAGTFVPDGTTVNFTTNKGNITPFSQTTAGLATATFTAPTVTFNQTATITASTGGKSGTTNVLVIAPPPPSPTPTPSPTPAPALVVSPASASLHCGSSATATFFISGGTPTYTVTKAVSSDPITPSAITGGSFTVVPTATACASVPGASAVFNLLVRGGSSPVQVVTVPITLTNP